MKKIFVLVLPIVFLAASCSFFSKTPSAGVVKTTNGGADWQFANTTKDSKTSLLAPANVSRLVFDPKNREIIYAATFTSGLFKSADSAASWTRILSKISVYDMAVHPNEQNTLYAAGMYGGFGKLLKTQDGGKTWEEVYNEQGESVAVRSVAVNPQNPNQVAIGTATGNVVLSSDGGLSWQLAFNFQDRVQRIVWQSGNLYILLKNKGLSRSSDGGKTFQNLTSAISKVIDWKNLDYNNDAVRGYNQFFVDVYSGNLIYLTTDQGLYKTVDAGATWQTQSVATQGSINYLIIDPDLPQISYAGIFLQAQ